MKYDQFLAFSVLNRHQQNLFNQYLSPDDESSLFKKVPLDLVDEMRNIARMVKIKGQRVNVKFRGPRYDHMRGSCRKEHARSAAIYLHQNYQYPVV